MRERSAAFGTEPGDQERGSPVSAAQLVRLMTLVEVADFLGVSQKTVRRLVGGRKLPCVRIGRVLRFQLADLLRLVEARKE